MAIKIYDTGQPWLEQYSFNNETNGELVWVNTETPMPCHVMQTATLVTNGFAYTISGNLQNELDSSGTYIFQAPINTDGTLGTWSEYVHRFPTHYAWGQVCSTGAVCYVMGGHEIGSSQYYSSPIYKTPILADGSIGAFSTDVLANPLDAEHISPVLFKGRMIVSGGNYGASAGLERISCFAVDISQTGEFSGTFSAQANLPQAQTRHKMFPLGDDLYLISGTSGGVDLTTIYRAALNESWNITGWIDTGLTLSGTTEHVVTTGSSVYAFKLDSTVWAAQVVNDELQAFSDVSGNFTALGPTSTAMFITSSRIFCIYDLLTWWFEKNVISAPFIGGLNNYLDSSYSYLPHFWTNFSGQTEIIE